MSIYVKRKIRASFVRLRKFIAYLSKIKIIYEKNVKKIFCRINSSHICS